MAFAARSSDVHTPRLADMGCEDNYKFAILSTVKEFQPKTNRQQVFMKIPALGSFVRGLNEDKMVCPVHALKIYMVRTNSILKRNPQMRILYFLHERLSQRHL